MKKLPVKPGPVFGLSQIRAPWAQDLDCAHAASAEMETQVRSIAGGWNDGDDPDEYWKVENGEAEKIQWRT